MPFARSFTGFRPTERYDAIPWNRVQIEESATRTGTYTVIDTLDLDPIDADPAEPQTRNFTTVEATLADAWYQVTFLDADDNQDVVPYPTHYPIAEGYPVTAELVAASTVDELTSLDSDQLESMREAAIVAVESFTGQRFVYEEAVTELIESGGGYEIYLPKRLIEVTSITPYGGDPLELDAITVAADDNDRLIFHRNVVGVGYYEQALYEVSGGDYSTVFPQGTLEVVGDWGWEECPENVITALRYDMEEQALADANALSSTVHAVRRLGLSSIGQGSLRAELITPPIVSPRVERLLHDYLWHGTGGKLV